MDYKEATPPAAAPAPVSLAEIRKVIDDPEVLDMRDAIRTWGELEALVELAEAYLDAMPGIHDECRAVCPPDCNDRREAARARLALAAKGVRP